MIRRLLPFLLLSTAFGQYVATVPATPTSGGGGVTATVIGTLANPASFSSPYTITLTAGAAIGDIVIVGCESNQVNTGTAYNWVLTDSSGGNTWNYASTTNTTWQSLDTSNGTATAFGYSKLATALTTSNTVTFTPSADGAEQCYVIDLHGATAFDQVVPLTTAVSTTQTTGSLTPVTTPEYGIGMFGTIQAWTAYGNVGASAATGLGHQENTSSTHYQTVEWGTLNSLSAATATMTQAVADNGSSLFLLFK